MLYRSMTAAVALTGTLLLGIAGAAAHDESKYPDWSGQWRRAPGTGIVWDESKPRGVAQQPPLTPTSSGPDADSTLARRADAVRSRCSVPPCGGGDSV